MKLLRFGKAGQELPGCLDGDGNIRALTAYVPDIAGEVLTPRWMQKLRALRVSDLPLVSPSVRIGPCVGAVGKFICIGLNFRDHAEEAGMKVPEEPIIFMKATSAIAGPNDDLVLPRGAEKGDWEVELGVVIGAGGRFIEEADAMRHVAGYCIVNDLSERAFQLEGTGQWVKGKSADGFGPLGPWLVTADEVADPHNLAMWLSVNGRRYQDGASTAMVHRIPFLISYISRFMSLAPGDVIATGTPAGVGMGQKPPVYLANGDTIELGIAGLGVQRQRVLSWESSATRA